MAIDLTGGLSASVSALPKEMQDALTPILGNLLDRITFLESKIDKDETALVQQILSVVDTRLGECISRVDQALLLIRRLESATLTLKLGPV